MSHWLRRLFKFASALTQEERADANFVKHLVHNLKRYEGKHFVLALDTLIGREGAGFEPSRLHQHPDIVLVEERDLFGPQHSPYEHQTPRQKRLMQNLVREFPFDLIIVGNNASKGVQRAAAITEAFENRANRPPILVVWNAVILENEARRYELEAEIAPGQFTLRAQLDGAALRTLGLDEDIPKY